MEPGLATILLSLAAILSLLIMLGHVFGGARLFVHPLRSNAQLDGTAKLLGYANWHLFTVVMLVQAVAYALVAVRPELWLLGTYAVVQGLGNILMLIVIGFRGFPQVFRSFPLYNNLIVWIPGTVGVLLST